MRFPQTQTSDTMKIFICALLLVSASTSCPIVHAQILADTLLYWQGYFTMSVCSLRVYHNNDQDRPHTIVLTELAENRGATLIEDISFVADQVGRTYGIDPTNSYWVVHWGSFSFPNATPSKKELFLRATFRKTSTNRLGAAQWRIIRREDIESYTDRHFH